MLMALLLEDSQADRPNKTSYRSYASAARDSQLTNPGISWALAI
jgi:hypothetical protein